MLYYVVVYFSMYTAARTVINSGRPVEASIESVCHGGSILYAPVALYVAYLLTQRGGDLVCLSSITILVLALVSWLSYYVQVDLYVVLLELVILFIFFREMFKPNSRRANK